MFEYDNENYSIIDWTPIWLDKGQRLKTILEEMQKIDIDEGHWIIMASMICLHIEHDLSLHAAGIQMLNEIGPQSPGEPL